MRIRIHLIIVLLISVSANIVLLMSYLHRETVPEPRCHCFPSNICSDRHVHGSIAKGPEYRGFTPRGESMEFIRFTLSGAISESVRSRYGRDLPEKTVRNIQRIVYFFLGYHLTFYRGDVLSFFVRRRDNRIVYMRYKSRFKNSEFETVLFDGPDGERYIRDDGTYLVPCITNGPFPGCPDVRLTMSDGVLRPLFVHEKPVTVSLPFTARVLSSETGRHTGGTVSFIYSNLNIKGTVSGLAALSSTIRDNAVHDAGKILGRSGFLRRDDGVGLVYHLRRDRNTVSPFSFHHIKKRHIDGAYLENSEITRNYYRYWYAKALKETQGTPTKE